MAKKGKSPKGRAKQKMKQKSQSNGFSDAFVPAKRYGLGYDGSDLEGDRLRNGSPRQPAVNTRNKASSFVRAGHFAPPPSLLPTCKPPEDQPDSEGLRDSNDIDVLDKPDSDGIQTDTVMAPSTAKRARGNAVDKTSTSGMDDFSSASSNVRFFVDTDGDDALKPSRNAFATQPARRAASPAPSDSSAEVVVFHGRGRPTIVDDPITQISSPSAAAGTSASEQTKPNQGLADSPSNVSSAHPAPTRPVRSGGWALKALRQDNTSTPNAPWVPAPAHPYWKPPKQKSDPNSPPEWNVSDLQETSTPDKEEDKITMPKASKRAKKPGKKSTRRMWNKPVVNDDDDAASEAAYEDYMENLAAQQDEDDSPEIDTAAVNFSKCSLAIGGPSVMVDGKVLADNEVLPESLRDHFTSDSAWEDASDGSLHLDPSEQSELDSSALESDLEYNEREMWEDKDDLRKRRMDAKTDEQIARLFSKQQELGIDDDELVIDDGDYNSMDDGIGDVDAAYAGLSKMKHAPFGVSHKKGGAGNAKRGFSYPSASAAADAIDQYGDEGFDIMDLERPSLRPANKGKGKMPIDLDDINSDSDLAANLNAAWAKDRNKKRLRKLEREQLRSEGLLGSAGRAGVADLKQKYAHGLSHDDIKHELRVFINDSSLQQRDFPPMGKTDRKGLHALCGKLGLTSRSQGAGNQRFTVISKKKSMVTGASMERVLRTVNNRFARNPGSNATRGRGAGHGRGGGGGGGKYNGVQHGEIVGASAEAIGSDSFGFKLMEKMGWKSGDALGKDGEGSLNPVEQFVRKGKSGLGS